MRTLLFVYIFISAIHCYSITSSVSGVGGGIAYNFQHMGVGANLRADIALTNTWRVTPQLTYLSYTSFFRQVNELYIGLQTQKDLVQLGSVIGYGVVGVFYNNWINSASFNNQYAQQHNWVAEFGGGARYEMNKLAIFMESVYNPKWQDAKLIVGVLFHLNNKKGGKPMSILACPSFASF